MRIIHEDISARRKLAQTLFQYGIARLIVGGVNDSARGRLDPKAQATLWMVYVPRRYFVLSNQESFSAFELPKFALGAH